MPEPSEEKTEMELLIGDTLLTPTNKAKAKKGLFPSKATKELLSVTEKDFILLYFSASYNAPCQAFTPTLIDFYKNYNKSGRFEVVLVSADTSEDAFNEYYGKMPWPAMQDKEMVNFLMKKIRIQEFPKLAIVQNETGFFLTLNGQKQFDELEKPGDASKLPDMWKSMKAKPLDRDAGEQVQMTFTQMVKDTLRNGLIFFILLTLYTYVLPLIKKTLQGMEDKSEL